MGRISSNSLDNELEQWLNVKLSNQKQCAAVNQLNPFEMASIDDLDYIRDSIHSIHSSSAGVS
jgi:hypothetical protein